MPKEVKKVSKVSRRRSTASSGASKDRDTVLIVNHMRCAWIVPPDMRVGATTSDIKDIAARMNIVAKRQQLVVPNEAILVDKGGFDRYLKGSKAFQALIDKEHLVVSGKAIDQGMLKSVDPVAAPPELTHADDTVAVSNKQSDLFRKMAGVTPINQK